MRHKVFVVMVGVCFLFGFVGRLSAQTQGTISGTVSDPSGAVIPKAEVTITNQQTGAKRVVFTSESGFYTVTSLDPATYTVTAKSVGFRTLSKSGIVVHVADEVTLPIVLQIGVPSETITVEAAATLVETRSGEISNVIGSQQISELPLNGRSFVQLTLLVPGAAPSDTENPSFTGLLGGVDISMSGSPANANAWLVNGVDNVDHGSGRTILVYPSVDSIEEFKIQRNSYGADMPSASGAQINLVTKQGTNSFHGSAYEFFRNDVLDANNFFQNLAGKPRPELRYNDFGYTFGGPIKKDKLFFFWSQEWRRQIRGVTRLSTVPTAAERQGNFCCSASDRDPANPSEPLDPYTGAPFPNDTIQSNRLSQGGLALMNLYPLPNTTPTADFPYNWVGAVPTSVPTRQEQIRGDWNLGAKNSIMVQFTNDYWANPAPNWGGDAGLWGDTGFPTVDSSWEQPSKALSTRLTTVFSASKANTFQFSYSNNRIYITEGLGKSINDDINSKIPSAFPNVPADRAHAIFWGAPENGIGGNLWNNAPWNNKLDNFKWQDDFYWVQGNHTHKIGVSYAYSAKDEDCCGASVTSPQFWGTTAVPGGAGLGGGWGDPNAPGQVIPNGQYGCPPPPSTGGCPAVTNNGLADLLLAGSYWGGNQQSSQPRSKVRWRDIEFYYADTFRVTRRLTLDFGARWSVLPPSIQADNRIGNFVPSLYDPAQGSSALNGMIYPAGFVDPADGISGGSSNLRGVDVGRALRHSSYDTVAPRLGFAFDPTGAGKWSIRGGFGIFYGRADLSQPIGEMLVNPPFNSTINFGNGRPIDTLPANLPTAGVGTATDAADIKWKTQGSYQWNMTVERELFRDAKLEVAYVGNRGNHLPINWDLNQVAPQNRLEWATLQFTPNSTSAQQAQRDALHELFPLKGTNSLIYETNGGRSTYHALQTYFTKRYSNNFSLGAAYTFSKLIAINGLDCCGNGAGARIVDPWNFRYNRGPTDFDRPHIVSFNMIYKLPALAHRSEFLRQAVGGWEGTAIYSYSTGIPLTVTLNQNLAGLSTQRPDLVGNPKFSGSTLTWLNSAAFALPTKLGVVGNEGSGILHGPPTNQADLAIYKNFPISEKTILQFRVETFNTFNHTQFFSTNIDTTYKVSGLSADLSTGQFTGCNTLTGHTFPDCNLNPSFGQATKARDPRELQLALKFLF